MRILHVNDYYDGGGAEHIARQTVEGLNDRGHTASLFTSADVPRHRRTPVSYLVNRRAARALADRLAEFRPDVVHLHNYYHELSPAILIPLGRWKREAPERRRLVMTAHDYHLVCPNAGLRAQSAGRMMPVDPAVCRSTRSILQRRWDHRSPAHGALKALQHLWHYRLHNRRAFIDLVLCPSPFIARAIESVGHAAIDIPNPIAPFDPPNDIDRPADRLHLVFTGRVEPEKGLADWIDALPADLNADLTIVGDGSDLEPARAAADRLPNLTLHTLGRLPRTETLRRIAAAHLLVLPSRCAENDPLVLIEALACRTNILVSNLGGPPELVRSSGLGFTFNPFDADSARAALVSVRVAFEHGDLNDFDPAPILAARRPDRYFHRLLLAYDQSADVGERKPSSRPLDSTGAPPCASC